MELSDYLTGIADIFPTYATLDPNVVIRQVNRARRTICRQTDASLYIYSYSLAVATQSYSLPTITATGATIGSPMKYVMEVACYIGNLRYVLTRIPAGQIPMSGFQGWPVWWWLLGEKLSYYPIPPSTYTSEIKGKLEPADLDISSNILETVIPEPYWDAVINLACEYCAIADGNAEMIKNYEALYQMELNRIPKGMI